MRWLRTTYVLGLSLLIGLAGCGSDGFDTPDGDDQMILSFVRFTGEGINQADGVGGTSADVDVCLGLCLEGEEVKAEEFTATRVNAVFVNRGKADILLDSYSLSTPGTGIPDETHSISALIPGGRCAVNQEVPCALDDDCRADVCVRQETTVDFLLYDFTFKELIRGEGVCPEIDLLDLTFAPGTIIPQTFETIMTFEGSDATGDRYAISTGYVGHFDDFDNCEE